jgi:hypothetical protein
MVSTDSPFYIYANAFSEVPVSETSTHDATADDVHTTVFTSVSYITVGPTASASPGTHLSAGETGGIAVGVILGALTIGLAGWRLFRRRKANPHSNPGADSEEGPELAVIHKPGPEALAIPELAGNENERSSQYIAYRPQSVSPIAPHMLKPQE